MRLRGRTQAGADSSFSATVWRGYVSLYSHSCDMNLDPLGKYGILVGRHLEKSKALLVHFPHRTTVMLF